MNWSYFTLPLACVILGVSAQQKQSLTIKDAVLKGRTTLAPQRINNIHFVNPTTLAYSLSNNLLVFNCKSNSILQKISLSQINSKLKGLTTDTLSDFPALSWNDKNSFAFSFLVKNKYYIMDINKNTLQADTAEYPNYTLEDLVISTNKNTWTYTQNYNLYVHYQKQNIQISKDGNINLTYGYPASRNEFGINQGSFFSNNNQLVAFYKIDHSQVKDYPIINWTEYPAVSENIKYPMAGQASQRVSVGIFNLSTKNTIYIKTEGDPEQYLTNLAFTPDDKYLLIAVVNRDQNYMQLNMYNTADGSFVKTLFEEKDDKYTEPLHPALFLKNNAQQFIWQSNRDGFNHLYLYDINGKLIKQLTKGNWEVKDVVGFDKSGKKLLIHSTEQSPIDQDIYTVDIASGKRERISKEKGFHAAVIDKISDYIVDAYTACDVPRKYFVTDLTKKSSYLLFEASNPLNNYITASWQAVQLKSFDGSTLYGRIFKPADFDSTKKYPVLVYLYNGPHLQLVTNSWMMGGEVWYHYMAQKGFIIFTIDGHGTPFRGKAFEQATFKKLGEVEMKDQLIGVDYLKSLKYVDANKLAVFGWSFGGFMTTSLMTKYPNVFKAAVAGGPVIDWNYYEIMYTERYMDSPKNNPDGYKNTSVLNNIQNLKGKLLVIHGAEDDVVVWQHSMLLLKKAIDTSTQLDYFVYPTHKHNVLGKDRAHLIEKVCNYIIENIN